MLLLMAFILVFMAYTSLTALISRCHI